jgi:hypothetical protein
MTVELKESRENLHYRNANVLRVISASCIEAVLAYSISVACVLRHVAALAMRDVRKHRKQKLHRYWTQRIKDVVITGTVRVWP